MTAEERTEKLILEIADRLSRHEGSSAFTPAELSIYLATHGIEIEKGTLAGILNGLVACGHLRRIEPLIFSACAHGLDRLDALRKKAAEDAAPAVDCGISEEALDGWWETADVEIKIWAFKAFYKPFKETA